MLNQEKTESTTRVTELLSGIFSDLEKLFKQEVALFKAEFQQEMEKAKRAQLRLGIEIVLMLGGMFFMAMALVHLLMETTRIPVWGCYGVTAVALILLAGLGRLYDRSLKDKANKAVESKAAVAKITVLDTHRNQTAN